LPLTSASYGSAIGSKKEEAFNALPAPRENARLQPMALQSGEV
jgi:hypothetical protein